MLIEKKPYLFKTTHSPKTQTQKLTIHRNVSKWYKNDKLNKDKAMNTTTDKTRNISISLTNYLLKLLF